MTAPWNHRHCRIPSHLRCGQPCIFGDRACTPDILKHPWKPSFRKLLFLPGKNAPSTGTGKRRGPFLLLPEYLHDIFCRQLDETSRHFGIVCRHWGRLCSLPSSHLLTACSYYRSRECSVLYALRDPLILENLDMRSQPSQRWCHRAYRLF